MPQKLVAQQDMQMLHRIRSRLVGNRTQLGNQIRGLLAEYGIVIPLHLSQLRRYLIELTSQPHAQLTPFAQELFVSQYEELCSLDERIASMEKRIQDAFHREEACQRIAQVEGVGPVIATALVAAIADGSKGVPQWAQLAAWLGLVPRQYSSGDKQRLLGISKAGRSLSTHVTHSRSSPIGVSVLDKD